MIRRLAAAALAAVLLSGCATAGKDAVSDGEQFSFVSPGGQVRINYPIGERGRVPELSGDDLMRPGERIRLSQFRGQVVVLNIWGSWCGPCRTEADDLQAVQNKTAAQGVRVLGIDVRDDQTAAQDFHRANNLTYPSIFDPSGRSLLALRGYPRSVVPSTIVLDRQHRVAAIFLTDLIESDLLPVVQRVAAEQRS